MKIQILILFPLFLLKIFLMMIYQKSKDLLEITNPCLLQRTGIQDLLLLICSLKKDLFKHSFLFLLISFMNGILMVCLNKKSLIRWVICLWLVLLIKIIMILINLKLLIYLLLVFLVRGWWDSYLTEESKDFIKHAVKKNDEGFPIFDESIGRGILDGVNTLIYTILKHFVSTPSNISSRVSNLLNNLRCPTMSDYR